MKPPSQCDTILETLLKRAGKWVSMPALVKASGSYNVHSRIDELRHKRGVRIENMTSQQKRGYSKTSHYRIPA